MAQSLDYAGYVQDAEFLTMAIRPEKRRAKEMNSVQRRG